MSAELLRRAAALMRERAESATPGPWRQEHSEMCANQIEADDNEQAVASTWAPLPIPEGDYRREEGNAEHIASWHPAVALAVAAWLEASATEAVNLANWACEPADAFVGKRWPSALAVARAYLGDPS